MIQFVKRMLGIAPTPDLGLLMQQGAQLIDVRTPGEFKSGHIPGAANIPLQSLQASMGKLKKDKPVITCCASGMRSASAKRLLKTNGFAEVHNGGGWQGLYRKLTSK